MKKLADEKERALTVKFVLIDFEIENLFFFEKNRNDRICKIKSTEIDVT